MPVRLPPPRSSRSFRAPPLPSLLPVPHPSAQPLPSSPSPSLPAAFNAFRRRPVFAVVGAALTLAAGAVAGQTWLSSDTARARPPPAAAAAAAARGRVAGANVHASNAHTDVSTDPAIATASAGVWEGLSSSYDAAIDRDERITGVTRKRRQLIAHAKGDVIELGVGTGTSTHTHTHMPRQTHKHTDEQTDRQTDGQRHSDQFASAHQSASQSCESSPRAEALRRSSSRLCVACL